MGSDTKSQVAGRRRPPHVTICLPDPTLRDRLVRSLKKAAIDVEVVSSTGHDRLGRTDLVVVRQDRLGKEVLRHLEAYREDLDGAEVFVLTESGDAANFTMLVQSGAWGAAPLRSSTREFSSTVAQYVRSLHAEPLPGEDPRRTAPPSLGDFASLSPRMADFLENVRRVLDVETSILITGETGVGKERLARAIHREGRRAGEPFISVNCAAIPENLIESELFGHERGAFTGAVSARAGRFALADRGTLFLDEIGELPRAQQAKLLNVLETRTFFPVGASTPIGVDIRVIAATNRDLAALVKSGEFREDLFYRLNVVPFEVPPLRARREDLPHLIGRFLRHFRKTLPRPDVTGIENPALAALLAHPWPGNVRELMNTIERTMLLAEGPLIRIEDLPENVRAGPKPRTADGDRLAEVPTEWRAASLKEVRRLAMDRVERTYLAAILADTGGRIGEAAERAGISARALYEKMRRLGLDKRDFKVPPRGGRAAGRED